MYGVSFGFADASTLRSRKDVKAEAAFCDDVIATMSSTGHVAIACLWLLMTSSLDAGDDFRSASSSRRLRTILNYSVEEEVPPGTVIGRGVAVDSGLTDRYGPEVVAAMRFRFLTSAPPYVEMDEVGGMMRTKSRVDREEICGDVERRTGDVDDEECSIRLDVAVQPMNYFHIFKVSLTPRIYYQRQRIKLYKIVTVCGLYS